MTVILAIVGALYLVSFILDAINGFENDGLDAQKMRRKVTDVVNSYVVFFKIVKDKVVEFTKTNK